jgi:hypothetical protein
MRANGKDLASGAFFTTAGLTAGAGVASEAQYRIDMIVLDRGLRSRPRPEAEIDGNLTKRARIVTPT